MDAKDFKELGFAFGLNFLANKMSGEDTRTSFRRAGVGSLAEQHLDPDSSVFVQTAIEELVASRKLESNLENTMTDPSTPAERIRARRVYDDLHSAEDLEFEDAALEMEAYADGMKESLKSIRRTRAMGRRSNLRRANLDK